MSEPRRLPSIAPYNLPQQADLPASRADWSPDPARAALLVHDMQAYFVDAFQPDCTPIAPMIANLARLVARCRAAGVPVFYTAQIGAQQPHDRGLQGHLWGPGMRHAPEHERIVALLAPAEGDIVLVKHRYSAFQRSNFAELLAARGRDQLLIGGVYAHIGCQCTAAEAFQRDIEPFFLADALADFSRDWHEASLANVADCLGVVLSTEQALASIQRDDDDA